MSVGLYTGSVVFTNETTKDVDVSLYIADATKAVPQLFDDTGAISALSLVAISITTYRITSAIPITGTYVLNVVGTSPIVTPPAAAVGGSFSPPTLDTLWLYSEARQKLLVDLDLQDELSITPAELVGYFNEGIEEAESEILKIDEDYFLTSFPLPLVAGEDEYDYPANCYAYKLRGLIFNDGSLVYNIRRFARKDKLAAIAMAGINSAQDYYQWYHRNQVGGSPKIVLVPAARETASIPPNSTTSTPILGWYIRHANRIPRLGQYIKNYDVLLQSTACDPTLDRIATSATYVTGDQVKLYTTSVLPAGLSPATVYYVIAGSGFIKLATTLANARAGTNIDFTSAGLGLMSVSIAATQTIVDNTIIDLPEFAKFIMQWAKCRCYEKMDRAMLEGAVSVLEQQRNQLTSTLSEIQQDDQTEITPDFSSYQDLS